MVKVATVITKLELGGAQNLAFWTARNLNHNKFESIFISGEAGPLNPEVAGVFGEKFYSVPSLVRQVNPLKDLSALIKIWRILRKEKPQIVHTHSSKAGIVARWAAHLAGVPIIIHTYHGFGFHDWQPRPVKKIFVLIESLTAKISDLLITVSAENVKKALENGIGFPEQYRVVHGAIDLKKFSRVSLDRERKKQGIGLNGSGPVVGMVACFKPQKAPLDFILMAKKVIKEIPAAKFIMVGDGELRPEIEKKIKELNLEKAVILTGWRRNVEELVALFDIFVLTSLWEGLPLVLLEGMAESKPIVATAVDGTKEIVKDGVNGCLVEPHDMKSMTEKVVELLKDREKATRMAEEGRKFVNPEFSLDFMVQKIEKVYEELSEKKLIKDSSMSKVQS